MGTHYSFGFLLEDIHDILYVSNSSNGAPECAGEYILSVLRTEGIGGFISAMVKDDLERVDHKDSPIFTLASEENMQGWTFSEWVYLYRFKTNTLAVCVPVKVEKANFAGLTGKNPWSGELGLYLLLEVPVDGIETIMDRYNKMKKK